MREPHRNFHQEKSAPSRVPAPDSHFSPMEITRSKRAKKMRSLAEIIKDYERGDLSKRQAEYDLPKEVLEFILSQLNLRDNIRASAVSTRWLSAAVAVRRSNSPPLLMIFPKKGDLYGFFDPSNRNMYCLDLPELRGSRIRYARNNWLLLERPKFGNFFLFCPYTRKMVELPELQFSYEAVAFSSAPTSNDCHIFAVSRVEHMVVGIRTCQPGANQWINSYHQGPTEITVRRWSQVIFSKGSFYCLSLSGQLGVFNVGKGTWIFYPSPPPKLLKDDPSFGKRWTAKFMAERDGAIYIVCVCAYRNPIIYMINMATSMKIDSLSGVTIFVNDISSQVRVDLAGKMVGNIVFSKIMLYGRRCVEYDPDQHRYYPTNRFYNWHAEESFDRVWIEAPEDTAAIFH